MCWSERYNSWAHKIKRKRVFKENRISTPPCRLAAVAGGRCNLVAAAYARTLSSRWFFFYIYFPLSETQSKMPEMTILSESEIWYTRIPSEPLPCAFNDRLQKDTNDFSFFSYVLSFALPLRPKKKNKTSLTLKNIYVLLLHLFLLYLIRPFPRYLNFKSNICLNMNFL